MTNTDKAILLTLADQLGAVRKGLELAVQSKADGTERDLFYTIAGGYSGNCDSKAEASHVASMMLQELSLWTGEGFDRLPEVDRARNALYDLARAIRRREAQDQDAFEREQVTTPEQRAEILDVLAAEQAEAARFVGGMEVGGDE